jgi:ribosomal protein S18 acetylase RimI-like enzyme
MFVNIIPCYETEAQLAIREVRVAGFEAMTLATALLQRARRADAEAGVWEAADVQWWWQKPRPSDDVDKLFWIDDEGPVAGVMLTSPAEGPWQCDPIVVPYASGPEPRVVWNQALEHAVEHSPEGYKVPVGDDDQAFLELAQGSGLTANHQDSTAWMDAADRPAVMALREGFALVDRMQRGDAPHPLRQRNGDGVALRLGECPLYDPALDLAVETKDGRIAGYSLYWFDPTTKIGLVEPVRVEDEFQRQGLARAMLTAGIDRLVSKGAERIKVSYETDVAAALYLGIGFRRTSTTTWYRAPSD